MAHNAQIGELLRPRYTAAELGRIRQLTKEHGTFAFTTLPNGLFPAAGQAGASDTSGYQYVWVRDNVHVAHAHYEMGDRETAVRAVSALMAFFQTQRRRFQAITDGSASAADPMNRPHIRFDGRTLAELPQKWPHAQNDALGTSSGCTASWRARAGSRSTDRRGIVWPCSRATSRPSGFGRTPTADIGRKPGKWRRRQSAPSWRACGRWRACLMNGPRRGSHPGAQPHRGSGKAGKGSPGSYPSV